MRDTDRDPRPDLREDHMLWNAVLVAAKRMALSAVFPDAPGRNVATRGSLWGLLHGLRCAGARLRKKRSTKGTEYLFLDCEPLLDVWGKEELFGDWLEPNKKQISAVFVEAKKSLGWVGRGEGKRVVGGDG